MEAGYLIGWLGLIFGLIVPLPQIIKIVKSKSCNGVSKVTYACLCCALVCYLIHAIYIQSLVFTIAQSINLITNTIVLILLFKRG